VISVNYVQNTMQSKILVGDEFSLNNARFELILSSRSAARSPLSYKRRVCPSVCPSHAGSASKLITVGSCRFRTFG